MSGRRVAEPTLHTSLRQELDEREWGISKFAEVLGVRYGVAARWVAEDPEKRVVPLPGVLVQIADTFRWDVVDVFRKAGYLPALDDCQPDPREKQIGALMRRFARTLRDCKSASEDDWRKAVDSTEILLAAHAALLSRIEAAD